MATRIFFASDVHGSELVFRKFVGAAAYYKANSIIMGGDLTGKMIVPIVEEADDRFKVNWPKEASFGTQELEERKKEIRSLGFYPYRTTPREMEELSLDESKMDKLFQELMTERLRKWCELAEEHMKRVNARCYLLPGNDDNLAVDEILTGSDYVSNPEGKVVSIDKNHEMISTGYANVTPWNCPRDICEEKLSEKIEEMASHVQNFETCLFNFHCPPFDSGLDEAPELDENLRMKAGAMGIATKAAGSKAIRTAIEKYQPLLGLHGHIHEARGQRKIGRTLCINPGSDYSEGVLRGCVIDLDQKGIKSYTFAGG
jgi:Icc-related predicted phosphoesterase